MYPEINDITHSLAYNFRCDPPLQDGWYQRTLSEITGITIHHTLSHSPWATAAYYVTKDGGRPTIPYHYWICSCGSVFKCLDITNACWHDHTGHQNANISIGMAGTLHVSKPTVPQLTHTAALIALLMTQRDIPLEQVQGHNDRSAPAGFPTACPGWDNRNHGTWRARMFALINAHLHNSSER